MLNITHIVEKPSKKLARKTLAIPGSTDACWTMFGMYVITSNIFDYLDEIIRNNLRSVDGKFQFTPAISKLAREEGLLGVIVDGTRYDIGNRTSFSRL